MGFPYIVFNLKLFIVIYSFFAFILLTRSNCGQTSNSFNFFMYSAFSLYPLISFAPSCNALRIYSSSFSSDACLHLLVWFCCSFEEHGYNFLLLRSTTVYHQNKTISIISTFSTKWFTIKLYLSIETNRGILPTSRDSFVLFKIST